MKFIKLIVGCIFLFVYQVNGQKFQRMHIPSGKYSISGTGSIIPANCIDAGLPGPLNIDFYTHSVGSIKIQREKGGVIEDLPFDDVIGKWVTLTGIDGFGDELLLKPIRGDDGYKYSLVVGEGGSVVGENAQVLQTVNPRIIDKELIRPLDEFEKSLKNSGNEKLYRKFRSDRKEIIDRSLVQGKQDFQKEIGVLIEQYKELWKRYQSIAAFPEESELRKYIESYLDEGLLNSSNEKSHQLVNYVFYLNLDEIGYNLATDYLSLIEGQILNTQQIKAVEEILKIKLPGYTGKFDNFKIISANDHTVRSVEGIQKFGSTEEINTLISQHDNIIVNDVFQYLGEDFLKVLNDKNISIVHTYDFFVNSSNFNSKKIRCLIQYSSDEAINAKIWNNQDNTVINTLVKNATNDGQIRTFSDKAELQEILQGMNSSEERMIILTDNNYFNEEVLQIAERENATIVACDTYEQGLSLSTTIDLDLESSIHAIKPLHGRSMTSFEFAKEFLPIYAEKVKQKSSGLIKKVILTMGAFIGAAWIIHSLFGFEQGKIKFKQI